MISPSSAHVNGPKVGSGPSQASLPNTLSAFLNPPNTLGHSPFSAALDQQLDARRFLERPRTDASAGSTRQLPPDRSSQTVAPERNPSELTRQREANRPPTLQTAPPNHASPTAQQSRSAETAPHNASRPDEKNTAPSSAQTAQTDESTPAEETAEPSPSTRTGKAANASPTTANALLSGGEQTLLALHPAFAADPLTENQAAQGAASPISEEIAALVEKYAGHWPDDLKSALKAMVSELEKAGIDLESLVSASPQTLEALASMLSAPLIQALQAQLLPGATGEAATPQAMLGTLQETLRSMLMVPSTAGEGSLDTISGTLHESLSSMLMAPSAEGNTDLSSDISALAATDSPTKAKGGITASESGPALLAKTLAQAIDTFAGGKGNTTNSGQGNGTGTGGTLTGQAQSQTGSPLAGATPTQGFHVSMPSGMGRADPATAATPIYSMAGRVGWAEEVSQKVSLLIGRQGGKAELLLNPGQLGKVEVSLQVQGDQTSIQFMAATPAAREALEQALPRLRELFQQAGIALSDAQVSTSDQQQAKEQGHGGRHASQTPSLFGTEDGMAIEERSGSWVRIGDQWFRQSNGLVDIFA
jgi:flagellar hook-length control protein FliK